MSCSLLVLKVGELGHIQPYDREGSSPNLRVSVDNSANFYSLKGVWQIQSQRRFVHASVSFHV